MKKSKRCGCSQCPGQGHREHAGYPKAHFRGTVPPTPLSTTLGIEKSYNDECPDLILDFTSQFCPSTKASMGTLQSSALSTHTWHMATSVHASPANVGPAARLVLTFLPVKWVYSGITELQPATAEPHTSPTNERNIIYGERRKRKGCLERKSTGEKRESWVMRACFWLRCWGQQFLVGDAMCTFSCGACN